MNRYPEPHTLTYVGLPDGRIRVTCPDPACLREGWARTYPAGHTTADWVELQRQHSGPLNAGSVSVPTMAAREEPPQ